MNSRFPNLNSLWAEAAVEELVRCGVRLFCLCPGSRSTPLTAAAARHEAARKIVHFDERGAAFCALGYARATEKPAAVVVTSGTAAANLYPAVIEAAMDGVPLLVLTADRPPELRASGANQTIDQTKLYADYPRWFFDLPCSSRETPP
ncbi:MAG TPA: thiamine pyrophosphate-binding protein, partial [candidate division Zixibacteria bacterium]|nr:thiamine pyrophosphate-binding protein [candidate division Zixibacteria bacterium]